MTAAPLDSASIRKRCHRIHRRLAAALDTARPDLSPEARHVHCTDILARHLFRSQLAVVLRPYAETSRKIAPLFSERLPEELDFAVTATRDADSTEAVFRSLDEAVFSEVLEDLTTLCREAMPIESEEPPVAFFRLAAEANECWRAKIFSRTPKGYPSLTNRPGHRKMHGAYYTPEAVVRYIVDHALASGSDDAPPLPKSGNILDPACGGGVFLLGIFLRLHEGTSRPEAILERLFGVDLDPTAVLTTRRTLFLAALWSVLQRDSPPEEKTLFSWARCLGRNIVSANALLDFPASPEGSSPEPESFAVVLGNPPYRKERSAKELFAPLAQTSLGGSFRTARMDIWYYFVHASLHWLAPGGRLAFIVPAYWLRGTGAKKMIDEMARRARIEELFLLGDLPVFPGVGGHHSIMTLRKKTSKEAEPRITRIRRIVPAKDLALEDYFRREQGVETFEKPVGELFGKHGLHVGRNLGWLRRLEENSVPLGNLGQVRQGIVENPARVPASAARDHPEWHSGEGVFVLSESDLRELEQRDPLSPEERSLLKPYLQSSDCVPYGMIRRPRRYLIYATESTWPMFESCPVLGRHLKRFRSLMEARRETRAGRRPWWHLHWPREAVNWQAPKMVVIQMARRPTGLSLFEPIYVPFHCHLFQPRAETGERLEYLTALINSRPMHRWFEQHAKHRGVGLDLTGTLLRNVPVRRIDFEDRRERNLHDEIVIRVRELQTFLLQNPWNERPETDRSIEDLESRINAAVCSLYKLELEELER